MILMACRASSGLQFSSAVHIYWGCRAVSAQSFGWEEHFSHEGQFSFFPSFSETLSFHGQRIFKSWFIGSWKLITLSYGNFHSECNFFANYNYLLNISFCEYNLCKIIILKICYRIGYWFWIWSKFMVKTNPKCHYWCLFADVMILN